MIAHQQIDEKAIHSIFLSTANRDTTMYPAPNFVTYDRDNNQTESNVSTTKYLENIIFILLHLLLIQTTSFTTPTL